MRTAGARVAGAIAVLAVYYWALLAGSAAPSSVTDAQLRQDIQDSAALFAAGRFADALPATERLAARWPTQAMHHERLALILQRLDRPEAEARAWEAMMAASPTPVDACPMVAEAYGRAGRDDLALAAFGRCASLPPLNPDFLVSLGQLLLKADRKPEARRAFERGLEIDPSYPDLHLLLGVRQFEDGQLRDARVSFERFLELAPNRRGDVAEWLARTESAR